ncbi:nitrite reductase small subunit NirD (plasmid) [Paracoccus liaowanqingii]|uniref:Nitrite reductase small subunit NirD n=1 Tax=Paracoccus liaowanqingii TaxID=2560053 RepID=A0A4Y5SR21_9RHOB|nr:nitrite reductase small subunit NirD [Paracoccus liaowanqingii]QDA35940.1 nitrite reductase small subunit NirD [Paracoccus liaowanqingii]
MSQLIDIAALEDIPPQGARVVRTPQGCVAVFRTADDRVFALDDRCPHKGGPLSEGIVHGTSVTCPLHNWVFDMATGQAQGADSGAVATHAVRVEGGRILLNHTVLAQRNTA